MAARASAAGFWDRHAPDLAAAGRLGPAQVDTFGMLCHLYADSEQLAEQLAAEGWVTATDKGQAASPIANLLRSARRDYVTLAREFGLTAASSARLPLEPDNAPQDDDPEAEVLRKLSIRAS